MKLILYLKQHRTLLISQYIKFINLLPQTDTQREKKLNKNFNTWVLILNYNHYKFPVTLFYKVILFLDCFKGKRILVVTEHWLIPVFTNTYFSKDRELTQVRTLRWGWAPSLLKTDKPISFLMRFHCITSSH